MNELHAIILGIVEGITEFLPISSTGHLILGREFLGIAHSAFVGTFEIAIQLGAIIAVVALYFKRIFTTFRVWWLVGLAFIPTAIVGFTFYSSIKGLLENPWLAIIGIGVGGVALLFVEWWLMKKYQETGISESKNFLARYLPMKHPKEADSDASWWQTMTWRQAIAVGCAQVVAFFPGVSRSAATIVGGLFAGMKRKASVEFSFLLAIPVMVAATGYDLIQTSPSFSNDQWLLLALGTIVSAITAFFAIKWLLHYVERFTFVPFAIYRILVAVVSILILF